MRKLLLLSFIIAFISCNENAERADTPYSSNDNKINSLFGDVDTDSPGTSTSKIIVEPTGLRIVKENKDTFVSVYSRVEKTFTYYESTLDTFTLKYNGGVKPPDPEPPAPEPPTGVRNNIVFEALFNGSNPFPTSSLYKQACCSYSATQSKTIVREGDGSFKVDSRATDKRASDGYRPEFIPPNNTRLMDGWYGYSVYMENWGDCGSCGEHIMQWHPDSGTGSAQLAIWTASNTFDIKLNASGGTSSSALVSLANSMKIVSNKWYDFVWHVKWSADNTKGKVEVWINGEKYVDFTGATLTKGGTPYFKIGINRWNMGNSSRIMYIDAVRVGNAQATYKDVAP